MNNTPYVDVPASKIENLHVVGATEFDIEIPKQHFAKHELPINKFMDNYDMPTLYNQSVKMSKHSNGKWQTSTKKKKHKRSIANNNKRINRKK